MTTDSTLTGEKPAVENVYIFISDALRWSALPESMLDRGAAFKTIASGCATMKSVPSIVSGVYPPTHGVETWRERLTCESLFDLPQFSIGFFDDAGGGDGGLSQVLGQHSEEMLADIEPPFFYLERDKGGHAPYGDYTYDEMIENVEQDRSTLLSHYEREIADSIERFDRRLDTLSERGLLEDTLVVFLGDHGELLGEYGLVGHTSPIVPEIVYVPTVFIHPQLPTGHRPESIGHVDIAPTIRSVLDVADSSIEYDGIDLYAGRPGPRFNSSGHFLHVRDRRVPVFYSISIWDGAGGHVFNKRGKPLAPLFGYRKGQGWNREFWKSNPGTIPSAFSPYVWPHRKYGNPALSKRDAAEMAEEIDAAEGTAEQMNLDEDVETRLEDLGYRT